MFQVRYFYGITQPDEKNINRKEIEYCYNNKGVKKGTEGSQEKEGGRVGRRGGGAPVIFVKKLGEVLMKKDMCELEISENSKCLNLNGVKLY